jgi:hypothetical protein
MTEVALRAAVIKARISSNPIGTLVHGRGEVHASRPGPFIPRHRSRRRLFQPSQVLLEDVRRHLPLRPLPMRPSSPGRACRAAASASFHPEETNRAAPTRSRSPGVIAHGGA